MPFACLDCIKCLIIYFLSDFRSDGYKDVRLVDGRSDIGFVEYETLENARVAKDTFDGFKITPEKAMKITYAKQ